MAHRIVSSRPVAGAAELADIRDRLNGGPFGNRCLKA